MDDRIAALKTEKQHSCSFYLAWFFKCYQATEHGWQARVTPDGRAIIHQDYYFWHALEVVGSALNEIIAHERWVASQNGGR